MSRQKKKNYIEGLEARINETSGRNLSLNRRVDELQKENASLKDKLRRLMSQVSRQATNCKESRYTQASSCLFVSLLVWFFYEKRFHYLKIWRLPQKQATQDNQDESDF